METELQMRCVLLSRIFVVNKIYYLSQKSFSLPQLLDGLNQFYQLPRLLSSKSKENKVQFREIVLICITKVPTLPLYRLSKQKHDSITCDNLQ